MTADEIKSLQAPLKERYQKRPDTAPITLRAEGRIGEGVTCKVETGKAPVEAGLHPATGGDGLAACSGNMLLEALVACAGVTLRAVATALDIQLRDGTVYAEGDLDVRAHSECPRMSPSGSSKFDCASIWIRTLIPNQLATLLQLTERYCVVYQTLSHPAKINVEHSVASS